MPARDSSAGDTIERLVRQKRKRSRLFAEARGGSCHFGGPAPGLNRRVGWVSICFGAVTGLVMGLWSFDGPVPSPEWLGAYGDLSRRLARLGHIACFGLGFLSLFLDAELEHSSLGPRARRLAAVAMVFGTVLLPLTLFGAAGWHPVKYALPAPALAVALAVTLVARGACLRGGAVDSRVAQGHEDGD